MSTNPNHEPWLDAWAEKLAKPRRYCARCVYDENTPGIHFDADGVCNYCALSDQLNREYPAGDEGAVRLRSMAEAIRADGKGKKYDVIVGVSGGCDSSLMLMQAVDLGLRPLAVHFDNTWDSVTAVENIHHVLKALNVELHTLVVDNREYDDIERAFIMSGTPDLDTPTDIGLASTLYLAAVKYGVKHIFEGHSFRTEGVNPLGWQYMDAKYIQSVHRQYGALPMKTFPNMWLTSQIHWRVIRRIRMHRPLYHLDHVKEQSKRMLAERFGWQWYGGHHLENRLTAFTHYYFAPRRLQADYRINGFAALVRAGQMDRADAIDQLSRPQQIDWEIVEMF